MLDLTPNDPIIKTYIQDLQHLKTQQVTHELGLKGPFQNLLDKAAKKRGWTLVPELSTSSGGRRIVPDGTVRDEYRLPRGWWEAKDTADDLAAEIQKKFRAGYRRQAPIANSASPKGNRHLHIAARCSRIHRVHHKLHIGAKVRPLLPPKNHHGDSAIVSCC